MTRQEKIAEETIEKLHDAFFCNFGKEEEWLKYSEDRKNLLALKKEVANIVRKEISKWIKSTKNSPNSFGL
jgi:hypothetical protein